MTTFDRDRAARWLKAMESGQLNPPEDVHDSAGWDRYWLAQMDAGPMEVGFGDMMASDPQLLQTLDRRRVQTILCVGAGLSSEPWALALHGFHVTVLDVSAIPRQSFRTMVATPSHPIHKISGLTMTAEDAIAFEPTATITVDDCPAMHRDPQRPPKGGGSMLHRTGDLSDADVCTGPFDVVIERRTLQLFKREEQLAALDRLAARMSPRAFFVSHEHRGAWRPDQIRKHFALDWARERGFVQSHVPDADSADRLCQLFFSTG